MATVIALMVIVIAIDVGGSGLIFIIVNMVVVVASVVALIAVTVVC